MKDLIVEILGEYEPVMTETYIPYSIDGEMFYDVAETVATGAAGVDWAWVAGACLFAIVLYSLFRILGVFFK